METHSMDRSKLQELAKELAKDLKTQADLSALTSELVKLTVETSYCQMLRMRSQFHRV